MNFMVLEDFNLSRSDNVIFMFRALMEIQLSEKLGELLVQQRLVERSKNKWAKPMDCTWIDNTEGEKIELIEKRKVEAA